jgi:hypothetical protein
MVRWLGIGRRRARSGAPYQVDIDIGRRASRSGGDAPSYEQDELAWLSGAFAGPGKGLRRILSHTFYERNNKQILAEIKVSFPGVPALAEVGGRNFYHHVRVGFDILGRAASA